MADEVSRKTILVLLLLTVIVSAIGTWVALDSVETYSGGSNVDYGTAHLRIGVNVPKIEPQTTDSVSGRLNLNILPNSN